MKIKQRKLWDLSRDGLTQGFIGDWLDCRMQAHLKFREGLGLRGLTPALSFGLMVHGILERVFHGGFVAQHILHYSEEVIEEIRKESPNLSPAEEEDLEVAAGMAEIVTSAYFHFYDFSKRNWIGLEKEFKIPISFHDGLEVPIRGKIDGIYALNDKLWLFETKTKGRIHDPVYLDLLTFELQVMLYGWAVWKLYGKRPVGVSYNLIQRPQLRRGKRETIPQFLQRVKEDVTDRLGFYFIQREVVWTDEDWAHFQGDFTQTLLEIRGWADRAIRSTRNSRTCVQAWGTCSYLPICSREDCGGFTRRSVPFPELGGVENGDH